MVDREKYTQAEFKIAFDELKMKARQEITDLNSMSGRLLAGEALPFFERMAGLADRLALAFRLAEQTATPDDNLEVVSLEADYTEALDRVVGLNFLPPQVTEFWRALSAFQRSTETSIGYAIQNQVAQDALAHIKKLVEQPGWDVIRPIYDQLENEANAAQLTQRLPDLVKYGTVYEAATRGIDWDKVVDPTDPKRLEAITDKKNFVEEVAVTVSNHEQMLDDDEIGKLNALLKTVRRYVDIYGATKYPDLNHQLLTIQAVIHRILHEHMVIKADRATPNREYFRPSLKGVDAQIWGEVQELLGELGNEIHEVEALGAQLASTNNPAAYLTPQNIAKITALKDKITGILMRNINFEVLGAGMLTPETLDYIQRMNVEVDKYITWLDFLLKVAAAGRPTTPAAAPGAAGAGAPPGGGAGAPERSAESTGKFREIYEGPLSMILDKIVTNDYHMEDDGQEIFLVVYERVGLETNKGGHWADLGKLLSECFQLYSFQIFKKGATLDLDRLVINWETAKTTLQSERGIESYARVRGNSLYTSVIDKLVQRARVLLNDDKSEWYASSNDLGNGEKLAEQCNEDLYNPSSASYDPAYAAVIDSFYTPSADPETDKKNQAARTDAMKFLTKIAWFDMALQDLATEVAIENLGNKRAAVKKKGGKSGILAEGNDQPQSWLEKISYKVGKNQDTGLYAAALAWIKLPHRIEEPDGVESHLRKSQAKNFHKPFEKIEAYLRYRMQSKAAVHAYMELRWKPRDFNSDFPPLSYVLRGQVIEDPTANMTPPEMKAYQEKVSRDPAAKKPHLEHPENNMRNYINGWAGMMSLMENASTCWNSNKEDEWRKLPIPTFETTVNKAITSIGTQAAIALSYILESSKTDSHNNLIGFRHPPEMLHHMYQVLRAALDTQIVYILTQIKCPSRKGWVMSIPVYRRWADKEYREYLVRYNLAVEIITNYFENNNSLFRVYFPPNISEKDLTDGLKAFSRWKGAKKGLAESQVTLEIIKLWESLSETKQQAAIKAVEHGHDEDIEKFGEIGVVETMVHRIEETHKVIHLWESLSEAQRQEAIEAVNSGNERKIASLGKVDLVKMMVRWVKFTHAANVSAPAPTVEEILQSEKDWSKRQIPIFERTISDEKKGVEALNGTFLHLHCIETAQNPVFKKRLVNDELALESYNISEAREQRKVLPSLTLSDEEKHEHPHWPLDPGKSSRSAGEDEGEKK